MHFVNFGDSESLLLNLLVFVVDDGVQFIGQMVDDHFIQIGLFQYLFELILFHSKLSREITEWPLLDPDPVMALPVQIARLSV